MIRALIFDFDGLILDTEGPIYQSWQELYQAHGQCLPLDLWGRVIGTYEEPFDPYAHLEALLGRKLDRETLTIQRREREQALVQAQRVRPGVEQYLKDARRLGLKIGLASSSSCRWVMSHLERLRLVAYFDCLRARDDVTITKPDPAVYISALECLGIRPEEGLAFEDSPNGILAAKRAGLFCVAVPNDLTRHMPLGGADLCLESLAEISLEDLLARILPAQPRDS